MNKLYTSMLLVGLGNLFSWWVLNGQFLYKNKIWHNPWIMSLIATPVGVAFWWATKLSYEHFGYTWNIRLIGFGVGTLVFGVMSYIMLNEIPTLKTFICLLLALAIILIQVSNVIK